MKHTKEQSRETRVEIYAGWLADDVDGLIHNINPPFGDRAEIGTTVLAEARERVAGALANIELALAADRAAHIQEPA